MRIIISPAKQMRVDTDDFGPLTEPVFLDRAEELKEWIQSLSYEDQKRLWACNDKLAKLNSERFATMDLHKMLTPALISYDGIQYTYMAPVVFEDGQYDYLQEHLCILSGFYGVLKPMDGVVPYRLEMQAKVDVGGSRSLYDFWGDSLYAEVNDESHVIVNLASKEYSKCIEKYLQPQDRFVNFVFGEVEVGKDAKGSNDATGSRGEKSRVIQKGVYCKMARGEMVRYLAGIGAKEPEEAMGFNWSGYHFDEERSDKDNYYFVRDKIPGK